METLQPLMRELPSANTSLASTRMWHLVLSGPNHTIIPFDHGIDPSTLKALYRFAASHRNAAISIEGVDDKTETVRLDPSFVDTQVGRELIAADLVPPTSHIWAGHTLAMSLLRSA